MTDYMVPTANEFPTFELGRTITPSPTNELGVKGIGEAGTIASSAAVINAICDALSPLCCPATCERRRPRSKSLSMRIKQTRR